ncbi:MAG: hypothetical protein KA792_11045 [Bacteroidales bacterium]|nr:hypothetical protein [Bacteroidales bacterium]
MKRETDLIEQIADPDNLRLAFWKARKAKDGKTEVSTYRKFLDKNLIELRQEILAGQISPIVYKYFKIYDPKERLICCAPFKQRVLHNAIMNICHNNFEKYQIYDSYASRIGKGTYSAIDRAKTFQKKFKLYLKLDVRKYFDSIDHNVLKQMLNSRFKDKKLLEIFNQIIDSYESETGKGLPIGNLTSQYFANHYLGLADHYIKEKLQVAVYVRYMDDMVIWSDTKDDLLRTGRAFKNFVEQRLLLILKPFCLNYCEKGLPFLGYSIFPEKILLNPNSKKRYKNKLKEYIAKLEKELWTETEYQQHILPLIAFTKHSDAKAFRSKCMELIKNRVIAEGV